MLLVGLLLPHMSRSHNSLHDNDVPIRFIFPSLQSVIVVPTLSYHSVTPDFTVIPTTNLSMDANIRWAGRAHTVVTEVV